MIKVFKDTKVFVCCPENTITGGTELLHQLVSNLRDLHINAFIVYIGLDRSPVISEVPKAFCLYNVINRYEIEDIEKNIVVLPEVLLDISYSIKKSQMIFWWLSVDNFYKVLGNNKDLIKWNFKEGTFLIIKKIAKLLLGREKRHKISINTLLSKKALNCYQSQYAHNFLIKNNFYGMLPLSDYINVGFIYQQKAMERQNKVLFNPKKGYKFTKKIINRMPHLQWVPLEGLDRNQLLEEFQTSKLYIDFGNHPGKDRIPREAVINGCAILTNTKGSAFFFEDIFIDDEYKVRKKDLNCIVNKIQYIINNYDLIKKDFIFYKKSIYKEKELFLNQVKCIFQNYSD